MNFDSIAAFIEMGGHGPYIWSAWGCALLVFVYNIISPIRQRRKTVQELKGLALSQTEKEV